MRRIFLIAGFASMVVACAPETPARAPDLSKFVELVPGQSTMVDATQLLGVPVSYSSIANQTLLQWFDYGGPITHLAILFGPDGRMLKVQ